MGGTRCRSGVWMAANNTGPRDGDAERAVARLTGSREIAVRRWVKEI